MNIHFKKRLKKQRIAYPEPIVMAELHVLLLPLWSSGHYYRLFRDVKQDTDLPALSGYAYLPDQRLFQQQRVGMNRRANGPPKGIKDSNIQSRIAALSGLKNSKFKIKGFKI
jgi:hypothetical protein